MLNRHANLEACVKQNKRKYVSLQELKKQWVPSESKPKQERDARYEGLMDCFRNVVRCNVAYKLKYCL